MTTDSSLVLPSEILSIHNPDLQSYYLGTHQKYHLCINEREFDVMLDATCEYILLLF